MNHHHNHHDLSLEDASRLAVTATAADLEHWACSVAAHGQVALDDLLAVLDLLRDASTPQHTANLIPLSAS
ncbi:MAG TPA: hypothetical protein VHW64_05380 [Nocardioides sp.]|jgi:hypothetical protein|uniref:hypothetical protein n=1 Tax=Nocardioides sp. TaxID=35761 RepID=UPI002E2FFC10|nr:hypothetical protein [Nocardioides sp.]HEX3930112.1 hypothetical protein [Nocardioides sp.]